MSCRSLLHGRFELKFRSIFSFIVHYLVSICVPCLFLIPNNETSSSCLHFRFSASPNWWRFLNCRNAYAFFCFFDSLGFLFPLPKKSGYLNVLRPIRNSFLLLRAVSNVQCGGNVLFFSSSGYSFFEKLVWALLVRLFNRQPVIVMVDGNFPAFWTRLPLILKYITSILFSQYDRY